jgi:hypothetical protein
MFILSFQGDFIQNRNLLKRLNRDGCNIAYSLCNLDLLNFCQLIMPASQQLSKFDSNLDSNDIHGMALEIVNCAKYNQ